MTGDIRYLQQLDFPAYAVELDWLMNDQNLIVDGYDLQSAVIVALVRIGIVRADQLRKNRRIGYVAVAALAVALPGVDPVTTAVEMAPLMILFEASIWVSVLVERRAAARTLASSSV